jgi:hypothetical protein
MRAGSFRRELTTGISGGRANQIGFPGDRLRCLACHVEENPTPVMSYPAWTKFNMFYGDTSTGGRIPTFAAACLGCHDTAAKAGAPVAHVKSMSPGFAYVPPTAGAPATWVSNEKCTDCHSDAVRKLGHQLPN